MHSTKALLPTTCVCGKLFTIDHALNCPIGWFRIIRHNEVRDLIADLMSEVCHDVCGTCPPTDHRRTHHLPQPTERTQPD